jgi:hypothetical protein
MPPWMRTGDGRRSEFYSSALVILAGVMLVIGFGFVASKAINSARDDQRLPDPPPAAALPGAGSGPSASPAPIPIEPAPSTAPSPPTVPPSTEPTTKPPDRGAIALTTADVPSLVDLSAEGSRDWVHWGEDGTFSLERDEDGGFDILEGTPSAPRFRHALSPERFAWTGGDPVDHSDGTPTGIRTCGAGNGFTLTAPASTTSRTLRLYLGVVASRGRLEARLTAGSGTRTATLEERDNDFRSVMYTLTYRTPKNAKISVRWVTQETFGSDCGGVALEAATLR